MIQPKRVQIPQVAQDAHVHRDRLALAAFAIDKLAGGAGQQRMKRRHAREQAGHVVRSLIVELKGCSRIVSAFGRNKELLDLPGSRCITGSGRGAAKIGSGTRLSERLLLYQLQEIPVRIALLLQQELQRQRPKEEHVANMRGADGGIRPRHGEQVLERNALRPRECRVDEFKGVHNGPFRRVNKTMRRQQRASPRIENAASQPSRIRAQQSQQQPRPALYKIPESLFG